MTFWKKFFLNRVVQEKLPRNNKMMGRPFFALFPQPLKEDDEIVIKGKVKDDAKEFSINFTQEVSSQPSNIAYHFKILFDENKIVENSKSDCMWNSENKFQNEWINGPGGSSCDPIEPIIIPYLLLGENFGLAFKFKISQILIYSIEDDDEDSRNLVSLFDHRLDFQNIQTIQAWGDVDKITELSFRYS